MAKDRSPKSPRNSLKSAVESVAKLFAKTKRAPFSRETGAKAMGYSGLNGVSATVLGSLTGYGLIQKKGTELSVSERAIAILHPTGEAQRKAALREAALAPPLFAQLAQDYLEVDVGVLTSKLIQMEFAPESAKKTAKVFLLNAQFAGLSDLKQSGIEENEDSDEDESDEEDSASAPQKLRYTAEFKRREPPQPQGAKVLATYKIPLGANEAELVFTGEILEPEDFDALIDYVEIFKKQFERKRSAANSDSAPRPTSVKGWSIEDIRKLFPADDDSLLRHRQQTGTMATTAEDEAEGY